MQTLHFTETTRTTRTYVESATKHQIPHSNLSQTDVATTANALYARENLANDSEIN